MDLHLRLEGSKDLARQVYRQMRAAIAEGRLRDGDRVPPTRELSRRLAVSRNTVGAAYEWLAAEGLLSGRSGAGSFVTFHGAPAGNRGLAAMAPLRARELWKTIPFRAALEAPLRYDFRPGVPDAQLFPFDEWRRTIARQVRARGLTAPYADPEGHPALRKAIALHVGVARGVRAAPDDVFVTQGAQHALDLVARVLLEPGTTVAVEDPGYPPPRHLFESFAAAVVGVPVDAEGLRVDALPDAARLVYVTPSHQFPLGMPMSQARRAALLDWAARRDAVVIEDDYDSEFRFGGRPLETLQSTDRNGRVLYVGSFSKAMLPSLRVGFLVAPRALHENLRKAFAVSGWSCQWPVQAALARFLEEGLLSRHIRKMRREYAARHARIAEALDREFAEWLAPVPSAAGMHVAAPLRRNDLSREAAAIEQAREAGVGVTPLSRFYQGPYKRAGFVLGYGAIPTARIDEGLRRLRACVAAATQARPRRPRHSSRQG